MRKLKNLPRPAKPLLEKDIQKTILSYLKIKKVPHTVSNADRSWGKGGGVRQSKVTKGWPDISGTLPVKIGDDMFGISLYIEVKTTTGSVKEEQKETLLRLADSKSICIVARNLNDVVEVVERYLMQPFNAIDLMMLRETLSLKLSDRRKKEVRDALNANDRPQ